MGVPENLKRLRVERDLSVTDLAETSGVSKPYIWQIESGRRQNPSGDKLRKLATALGVTIADLIGASEGIPAELLEEAPESLRAFVDQRGRKLGVRREDVMMLQHIHYRGRRPQSIEDWELIYLFLKRILEA